MTIKKAILTGGGRATRLRPITATINKHLLPLAGKPMIFHAIEKVVAAGIEEIFINLNPGDTTLPEIIGSGDKWGISITYFEQTGGPQGIAHVVNEAHKFIDDDPFMFYLSDNIILDGVDKMVKEFGSGEFDCMLALSKVPDPERFGVPVFDESGALMRVDEKPENPASDFAVTGIYLYGPKIFFEAFGKATKSTRGEYEISDIHTTFLTEGKNVGYQEITGWWKDTGKPDDLIIASRLLLEAMPKNAFSQMSDMNGAKVEGSVQIGKNVVFGSNVELYGPVIIADGCHLENCVIGPDVTLGVGTSVRGGARIGNSIVLDAADINCPLTIAGSMIGNNVQIKKRPDDASVHSMIVGDKTVIEY